MTLRDAIGILVLALLVGTAIGRGILGVLMVGAVVVAACVVIYGLVSWFIHGSRRTRE